MTKSTLAPNDQTATTSVQHYSSLLIWWIWYCLQSGHAVYYGILGWWYVCMLHCGSSCSLAWVVGGCIMCHGIVGSCQYSEIVKHSWAWVHRGAVLYQVLDLYLYLYRSIPFCFSALWIMRRCHVLYDRDPAYQETQVNSRQPINVPG